MSRIKLLSNSDGNEFFYPYWGGARAVFCEDPAENHCRIISRREMPPFNKHLYTVREIISISMVGIVVNDVDEVANFLSAELGADIQKLPQISIVGDAHGALLVVPEGRPWQPTGKKSEIHEQEITILGETEKTFEIPGYPYTIHVVTE